MTEREAHKLLEDVDLVPVMQASIQDIKRLVGECLAADIPAALDRCEAKG